MILLWEDGGVLEQGLEGLDQSFGPVDIQDADLSAVCDRGSFLRSGLEANEVANLASGHDDTHAVSDDGLFDQSDRTAQRTVVDVRGRLALVQGAVDQVADECHDEARESAPEAAHNEACAMVLGQHADSTEAGDEEHDVAEREHVRAGVVVVVARAEVVVARAEVVVDVVVAVAEGQSDQSEHSANEAQNGERHHPHVVPQHVPEGLLVFHRNSFRYVVALTLWP